MKLQIPYKLLGLYLLFFPFIASATNGLEHEYKTTKERTISKSFNVNKDATLRVDNSFGNINIITWDESRIEFDITIKVSGNNAEKVEERLSSIDVDFSSSSTMVSAITKIEKNKKNWWNWGKKMNLKMEIDYIIKMPMTNNVDLRNKFGAITLDKLKGTSKIRCDHGKITTKELLSKNNVLEFNHTRDNYFEYINHGYINATHSSLTIANAEQLDLKAEHTRSTIEVAEKVNFRCSFGSLKIDNINAIQGRSEHLTTRIGKLYKNAELLTSHGTLKIEHMAPKVSTVAIESEFTSITLGYDTNLSFNFDFYFEFGSLRDSEGFNFINKEIDKHDKRYKGYYGAKDSSNHIRIKSEHGSVSFKKQS